jgi:glycosyltransferase involved in cell wall biosynthesis
MADPLEHLAARLGVADAVSLTDRVEDSDYRQELARADVAVQLRAVVNGEASAAVADCLAAGIPTLVTTVGAHADLPPRAAFQVRSGASAHEIAGQLLALLADPEEKEALSKGARAHAGSSSFATAAGALTEALIASPPIRD